MKIEQRTTIGAELRAAGKFQIRGYAARYGVDSHPIGGKGGFVERIAPGAFDRSLKGQADVKATFNHDANHILGRTKSGTLKLDDDSRGLRFNVQLDEENSFHRDLYSAVQRGDIDECSFAFNCPDGGDTWAGNQRTLRDVDLIDVAAVTYPSYPSTSVDARSLGQYVITPRMRTSAQDASVEILIAAAGSDIARRSVASVQMKKILADADAERRAKAEQIGRDILADQFRQEEEERLQERMLTLRRQLSNF